VNLPNALTIARIMLVAPMIALLLDENQAAAAAAVFIAGALTDVLDGHLARSRGLITTFGKLMDPIADKLLIGGAFVCLAATGRLAAWVVAVILAREALVTGLRAVAGRRGIVISANALGKAKTGLQTVTIVALIAATDPAAAWVDCLVGATVAITIASGAAYFAAFIAPRQRPAMAVSGRG
jgi:CDP-diacylglycerol---glycerol-3-phosphate 3-phosphatidyltransferase